MNRNARLAFKLLPLLFAFALLFIVSLGAATQMDSTNYNQTKTASASGGNNISSTNYLATVTIGGIIGQADSATYNTTLGFQADEFDIDNSAPIVSSVILNATDKPLNTSNANLTAWVTASDPNGDDIAYAWDWRKENVSIAILNMNFDVNDSAGAGKTKDYTTNSNNGTLGNGTAGTEPVWNATAGWNGTGAYVFDGDDDAIILNKSLGTGALTITAWIKPDSDLAHLFPTIVNDGALKFAIRNNVGVQRIYFFNDGYASTRMLISDYYAYTFDEWTFVGVTRKADGTATIYSNGEVASTENYNVGPITPGAYLPRIGGSNTSNTSFDGVIDSITIWNRSLSPNEMRALYNNRTDLIVDDEISKGENWSVCVTPNDGLAEGTQVCSNELLITNGKPIINSFNLTISDYPANSAAANLTGEISASDNDDDDIRYAWDWRTENTSIAVLNMNFDVNDSAGAGMTKDYSTWSNNGTISGAIWNATGGWNNTGAYDFTNDVIKKDSFSFDSTAGSFVFWMKPDWDGNDGSYQLPINMRGSGDTRGASIQMTATGNFYLFYDEDGVTSNSLRCGLSSAESGAQIASGNWYHVAAAWDRTTGDCRLYLDGTQYTGYTTNVGTPMASSAVITYLHIGGQDIVGGNRYNGTLDEVRVFNISLSEAQILALYNNRSDLIVSDETAVGENWSVCATPNDGEEDGDLVCTEQIEIQQPNTLPEITSVILNATDNPYNRSSANLTAYVSTSDADGHNVSVAWDWRKEDTSVAVLNLNFDTYDSAGAGLTKDYSTFSNDGTVSGVTWNATGGWNGTGAYEFDSAGSIRRTSNFNFIEGASFEAWFKLDNYNTEHYILSYTNGGYRFAVGIIGTTIRSGIYNDSAASTIASSRRSIAAPALDTWNHVLYVWNGTNGTLYLNGTVGTGTSSPSHLVGVNYYAVGSAASEAYSFNGTIDNVRIWNATLTQDHVLSLYSNQSNVMPSEETAIGDNWSVCLTPNDGYDDGVEVCSDEIEIRADNYAPSGSVTINATDNPLNTSNANLTAYVTASDDDGDNISYAWDWRKENVSIAVVNMNFDVNDSAGSGVTKDYSTHSNNGTVTGATWNATGGWNGSGAYFTGGNSQINITPFTQIADTISLWFNANDTINTASSKQVLISFNLSAEGDYIALGQTTSQIANEVITIVNGVNQRTAVQSITINPGWHNLVVVWNVTADKHHIFLDNVEQTTVSSSGYGNQFTTNTFVNIGHYGGVSQFNGYIDNLLIYNHSISRQQINALYNNRTHLIVSDETDTGENWSVCVTPNDGTEDGSQVCSDELEIQVEINVAPSLSSVILNATDHPDNLTSANLTAWPQGVTDPNGDDVSLLYDWRLSGTSILRANYDFDIEDSAGSGETKDYSTYSANATLGSSAAEPTWNATGGWNGTGAYMFDGGDSITVPITHDPTAYTIMAWVKPASTSNANIIARVSAGISHQMAISGSRFQHYTYDTDARWVTGSTPVVAGTWYHVAIVAENNGYVRLFVNGEEEGTADELGTLYTGGSEYTIGTSQRLGAFTGTIDSLMITHSALSKEQIAAFAANRSDTIVRDQTSTGQAWSVCVTPDDGLLEGDEECSNTVTIIEGQPNVTVTLNATNHPDNTTSANLTANAIASDPNGWPVNLLYDWREDGVSEARGVYNFDIEDDAGTLEFNDYSSYGNDGLLYTAAWNATGGWNGTGALTFNGAQYAYIPLTHDPSAYTIMAWVKPASTSNADIIARTVNGVSHEMAISGGYFQHYTFDTDVQSVTGTTPVVAGTWYHVAIVAQNSGAVRLYVNGVEEGTADTVGSLYTGGSQYTIGSNARLGYFSGTIDELRIYHRVLSEAQIAAIANNRTNIVVSDETVIGDNWTVCVTPNNAFEAGEQECSNQVEILDYYGDCPDTDGEWTVSSSTTITENVTCDTILVTNSAILTVDSRGASYAQLWLNAKNITIDAGSSINATKRGYQGGIYRSNGFGPGAGIYGATYDGTGAGHGGLGGTDSQGDRRGAAYGNVTYPTTVGSGGAACNPDNRGYGDGGGAIVLNVVDTLNVTGILESDGGNGNTCGGGSGGSILIVADTLVGSGSISADGGLGTSSWPSSGSGAGGRIAFYTNTNTFDGSITTYGGDTAYYDGGAGTIYYNTSDSLVIDNTGRSNGYTNITYDLTATTINITDAYVLGKTLYATTLFTEDWARFYNIINATTLNISGASYHYEYLYTPNLTIPNGATLWLSKRTDLNELLIRSGGTLTHIDNAASQAYTLNISAVNVTVDSGGYINVTKKGYTGATATRSNGNGPGGGKYGATFDATGAGHGGTGASDGEGDTRGSTYGNLTHPITIGSGGASGNTANSGYGDGGGAIFINASGVVNISGTIIADGGAGVTGAGGGSGGSVYIVTDSLVGSGTITANGGVSDAANTNGAGGGGRIALHTGMNAFSGAITAYGGNSLLDGGAGTIYYNASDMVVINNAGRSYGGAHGWTVLNFTQGFTQVNISNAEVYNDQEVNVDTFYTGGTAVVINALFNVTDAAFNATTTYMERPITGTDIIIGGSLSHTDNGATQAYTLNITAVNLTVETGGIINVTKRGYTGGNPDRTNGNGPGKGYYGAVYDATGAGHGGYGASDGEGDTPGSPYGDILYPVTIGSGGASGNTANSGYGDGGGAVFINASDTVTLSGDIIANGGDGITGAGGGSGGSILIFADTITGSGDILAEGGLGTGSAGAYNGGGGGGRIALFYKEFTTSGEVSVDGGNSYAPGQDGTIFRCDGTATLDCPGTDGTRVITTTLDRNYTMNLSRILYGTWDLLNIGWNDSASYDQTNATYTVSGMNASTNFTIYRNSVSAGINQSDGSSNVGPFTLNITGMTMIELGPTPTAECNVDGDCEGGKVCLFDYCFSGTGMFILKNDTQNVTFIDSYGRAMIAGTSSTSQSSCSGEFPIEVAGTTVGAVDKTGDLCLTGTISESQSLPLAPPGTGGLLIRNSTGSNVAYFDTSGNMVLGADLIESGFT